MAFWHAGGTARAQTRRMPPVVPGPRSRRRTGAAAALAAVALLTTACAGGAAGDRPPSGAEVAAPAPATAEEPLAFRASTLAGPELDVSTLAGQPVVLWFWAPWCTICRVEAPDVAAVAADLEGDVTFLGVPGRGDTADMASFVQDTGTEDLQHLVDVDGSLWQRFRVVNQPSFAFVGRDGSLETFAGALGAEQLRTRASALAAG
jgi:thiol-disulfide isomerase/thioredoxin